MPSIKKLLQAAAGNAGESLYVEDVFSTYLYTGTGSALDITNNIDLSGEGGAVWIKNRTNVSNHALFDTERGAEKLLFPDDTAAEQDRTADNDSLGAFNADGFSLQASTGNRTNESGSNFASWTFREAEKFFDVVTYTGNGVAGRTVAHNLGSTPAVIIVKSTDGAGQNWRVYHSALGNSAYLNLNTTEAVLTSTPIWNNTSPTDSVFSLSGDGYNVNDNGFNYVAYLFASDAGGFGDDGDESIIKCGSYTGNGSATGPVVDLGFEPQYLLIKEAGGVGNWVLHDTMRGIATGGTAAELYANLTNSEVNDTVRLDVTATGFAIKTTSSDYNQTSSNYIYIAIRRPMKTPESGTEVFNIGTLGANRDNSSTSAYYAGFPVDMALKKVPVDANANNFVSTRMLGTTDLKTNSTNAERTGETEETFDSNTHWNSSAGTSSTSYSWMFKRATGFFDVVCFNGVSGATAFNHNLGVVPEMMIVKKRSNTSDWTVYHTGYPTPTLNQGALNLTGGSYANASFSTIPTSTQFTFNAYGTGTQVAYLFATLAGVSKVGSYTGTGADLNVDCGFSAGARFILIKRTDSTGDWYVWDSARGIVAGNDPYLLLNTTAAEVTSTDYIDPLSSGFTVTSSAPAALNASGGTYIFLAIA
jgi:hypothetical protein